MDVIKNMKYLLLLTIITFSLSLQAKDSQNEYAVFGVGGKTCKSFTRAIQLEGVALNEYNDWLLGYFSAYNQYIPNTYDIMGARRMDQVVNWLNKYCKKNPNHIFSTATATLLFKMHKTRRNISPNRNKNTFSELN